MSPAAGLFAPQDWRSEPYRPPDFAGFFANDPEGARARRPLGRGEEGDGALGGHAECSWADSLVYCEESSIR